MRFALAAAAVCLPFATPAAAQTSERLDAGAFELLVNGRPIGTERFIVLQDGSSIRAAARLNLDRAVDPFVNTEVRIQLDPSFRPNRYELIPQSGPLEGVVAIRQGDRLRVQTTGEEGERVKEFMAPEHMVVLERGVAHHYFLLFRHVDAGDGVTRVNVVVPSERKQFSATLRPDGEETIEVGGLSVPARRFIIESGQERHRVWIASDGRVLRAEVPSLNWTARRMPE